MTGSYFTPVIGLEVHIQINTRTKLFCSCPYEFGAPPNSRICPVCTGQPGALPVFNRTALEKGIRAGLALGCRIAGVTKFDRKNYFYPDLPKGYQISQFNAPFATEGRVQLPDGDEIRLERIHLEEDAGKNIHKKKGYSLVDLNRCSVPLLEVVSKPEIHSPKQAYDYLAALKQVMQYTGVSDCDMEKGSLRCDANISLMPEGSTAFGAKVEIKNLNSFRNVQRALTFEIQRQTEALQAEKAIHQETRHWDEDRNLTRPMRSKEEAQDYRYFPDPDLPAVTISRDMVKRIQSELPELPLPRLRRLMERWKLSRTDATVITGQRELADFFEATAEAACDAKQAVNWIQGELLRFLKEKHGTLKSIKLTPTALASLIDLVESGQVTGRAAKKIFDILAEKGGDPGRILKKLGLAQIDNEAEISAVVNRVITDNPKSVQHYLAGKDVILKALMGQIMQITQGRANPQKSLDLLKKQLPRRE